MVKSEEVQRPLFQLGQTVMTPGASDLFIKTGETPLLYYLRHQRGDWGDLCEEDVRVNKAALKHGLRLMSEYHINGEKIWVITEADRSVTTILLPEEY